MAKIFYTDGRARRGILRAVISAHELALLLSEHSPAYLGATFPEQPENSLASTLIEITSGEECQRWPTGFYRVAKTPIQFEDSLCSLRNHPAACVDSH